MQAPSVGCLAVSQGCCAHTIGGGGLLVAREAAAHPHCPHGERPCTHPQHPLTADALEARQWASRHNPSDIGELVCARKDSKGEAGGNDELTETIRGAAKSKLSGRPKAKTTFAERPQAKRPQGKDVRAKAKAPANKGLEACEDSPPTLGECPRHRGGPPRGQARQGTASLARDRVRGGVASWRRQAPARRSARS